MVLKTAPKFEDVSETDAADVDAPEAVTPTPVEGAAVVTLPTVSKPAALVTKAKPINMADYDIVAALENRLPAVGFGEGTRLVGSNGNVMDGDGKLLGDRVNLLLMSWNKRWVVSPGTQGAESKEKARYSLDGVTTTQGEDIQTYLRELKDDGFDKAALKEYVDLFGLLTDTAKASPHKGKAVTISLSPDSVKAFMGMRRDLVVQGMTGKLPDIDPNAGIPLKIETEVKTSASLNWTRLVCSLDSGEERQAA